MASSSFTSFHKNVQIHKPLSVKVLLRSSSITPQILQQKANRALVEQSEKDPSNRATEV